MTKTVRIVHPTYGTVSNGSMRNQDILPDCMDVLLEYYPLAYRVVTTAISIELGITYTELCGDQDNPAWDTEMMLWIVREVVWDAMDEIAPDGYYFGAHPGDGSDYGYWEIEDWEDNEPCCACCERSGLTLLACPRCGDLLCQDCLDEDKHTCEPDHQDVPALLACICGKCAQGPHYSWPFWCEHCHRRTPWCRGANNGWPGRLCDDCAAKAS